MRPFWLLCWLAAIPVAALGQGMPPSHKAAPPGASSCGGCHALRPVAGQAGTFRITTSRLSRGTHVLHARAVDGAGNVQASPRRVTFRLR